MTGVKRCTFAVAAIALWSSAALGETIEHHASVLAQPTGWTEQVLIPQFDPALGDLLSVNLSLSGEVEGTAAYESLNASSAEITLVFAGRLALGTSSLEGNLAIAPTMDIVDTASAFDGVIDLAGTSGATYAELYAADAQSVEILDAVALAGYVGQGTVPFSITSSGLSHGKGAGNLLLNFQQNSGAAIDVAYTYSIPEPSMLALLLVGTALMFLRRRPVPLPIPIRAGRR